MNASLALLWDQVRADEHISQCRRYRILVREQIGPRAGMLLCLIYFYGYLASRQYGPGREELVNSAQQWCGAHRARTLPLIGEFEAWAARRYHIDMGRFCGAHARRDNIREAIERRGEGNLGLPILTGHGTMTIMQTFQMLYESIEPEAA